MGKDRPAHLRLHNKPMRTFTFQTRIILLTAVLLVISLTVAGFLAVRTLDASGKSTTSAAQDALRAAALRQLKEGTTVDRDRLATLLSRAEADIAYIASDPLMRTLLELILREPRHWDDLAPREPQRIAEGIGYSLLVAWESERASGASIPAADGPVARALRGRILGDRGINAFIDAEGLVLTCSDPDLIGRPLTGRYRDLRKRLTEWEGASWQWWVADRFGQQELFYLEKFDQPTGFLLVSVAAHEVSSSAIRDSIQAVNARLGALHATSCEGSDEFYARLRIIDLRGKEAIRIEQGKSSENLPLQLEQPWFTAAYAEGQGIRWLQRANDEDTGRPMVRISAPIEGLRKRLGVVVFDLDLTTLAGRFPANSSLLRMVTDSGGIPLVGGPINPLAHAAITSSQGESAQSGEHICMAAHATAGTETWAIVHAVATSEVMHGVAALEKATASAGSRLQRDLWLAAAGIAGLGVLATMLLLSSLTKPLRRIALSIDACAAGVAAAARQLSTGSSQLAELADHSNTTVQMVTNEVATISTRVKETNSTAEQAAQVVAAAASSGERCRNAIDRASTAMNAVAASSHHNRQVATHIQDIAFQTRIIAINAAIENRRAAEKNGTFGVIVSHVKRLANESRDAARSSDQLLREGIDRSKGAEVASHEARNAVIDLENALDQAGDVAATMSGTATLVDSGVTRIKGGLTDLQRLGTSTSYSANDQAQLSKDLDLRAADLAHLVNALTNVLGQNHSAKPSSIPDHVGNSKPEAGPRSGETPKPPTA